MALIAKGLVQAKPLAIEAYYLIFSTLAAANLTSEARAVILGALADMQGVRRLSNLLCPALNSRHGYDFVCGGLGLYYFCSTARVMSVSATLDMAVDVRCEMLILTFMQIMIYLPLAAGQPLAS